MLEFGRNRFGTGVLDFDRARRWFTENYGWSQDCETRSDLQRVRDQKLREVEPVEINPVWAYLVQYSDYRIYVASEKELTWFLMSHPIGTQK